MYRVRAAGSIAAWLAAAGVSTALFCVAPARAESCPGNPNALGTSRVLPVTFGEYTQLGTMQYKQTLPLADHEVVLTFDDGPMRLLSDKALDILNAQCVKVTYFIIGQMAHYFPDIVRREYASGDVIGTHSEHHPLRFDKLTDQQVQEEINEGIASVGAALGDPTEVAPFFRIPGLGRSQIVEQELARRDLTVFSADVVADDWFRHITPAQIIQRAMSRLEKRGRGILLLHDIHPATVLALPGLLRQLKDNGFHVVQVVPAPSGLDIAGVTRAWTLASAVPQAGLMADDGRLPFWPQPAAVAAPDTALPAPDAAALALDASFRAVSGSGESSAAMAHWPTLAETTPLSAATDLPIPGLRAMAVSLRGEKLVGADVAATLPAGVAAANPAQAPVGRRQLNARRPRLEHAGLKRAKPRHARLHYTRRPTHRASVERHRA